jgi:hypothetical protein
VPPGQEGKIELAVDHTDGYVGEVAKSAKVTTNDPKQPTFSLILRARFKPDPAANPAGAKLEARHIGPLLVEPADRWSSSVLVGGSAATTLYLVNDKPEPIHIKKVISGANFRVKLEPIQDGKRYQLDVSSNPVLKPGHYKETLRVVTDNKANPDSTIDVDLTVYPKVFATPNQVNITAKLADLDKANLPTITIRKLRETNLQIKSYKSTVPFLKLELVTDVAGQLYRIKIKVDKNGIMQGGFSGEIQIETNDADLPLIKIPIKGNFT